MTKIATRAKMRAGITWFPKLLKKSEGKCNLIVNYKQ